MDTEDKLVHRFLEDYVLLAIGFLIFGLSIVFNSILAEWMLFGLILSGPLAGIATLDIYLAVNQKSLKQKLEKVGR